LVYLFTVLRFLTATTQLAIRSWPSAGPLLAYLMAPSWLAITGPTEVWLTAQCWATVDGPLMARQQLTSNFPIFAVLELNAS